MNRATNLLIGTASFAAALFAITAVGQAAAGDTFIDKAAQGGMAEVQLGQLAQTNGASDQVKSFGQRMVADHSKLNDQVSKVANQKGITLPTSLSAKDQATKDRLSGLKGHAFDVAYMEDMVRDHKADIAEFQKEANSGQDAQVRDLAKQALPTLQEHLRMAEQTLAAVRGKTVSQNTQK